MACQHIFKRNEAGEVACSICYAFDDEMEPQEQNTRKPARPELDENKVKGFPSGVEDFWGTQVSFE